MRCGSRFGANQVRSCPDVVPVAMTAAAASAETTLEVSELVCQGCVRMVESALTSVEGVLSASVSLETGLATIVGSAAAETLVETVKATGRTARDVTGTGATGKSASSGALPTTVARALSRWTEAQTTPGT